MGVANYTHIRGSGVPTTLLLNSQAREPDPLSEGEGSGSVAYTELCALATRSCRVQSDRHFFPRDQLCLKFVAPQALVRANNSRDRSLLFTFIWLLASWICEGFGPARL